MAITMSCGQAQAWLESQFKTFHYRDLAISEQHHSEQIKLADSNSGASFYAVFPGYKCVNWRGEVKCDYRVDIEKAGARTALSHANLVIDIVHKVQSEPDSAAFLYSTFEALARNQTTGVQESAATYHAKPASLPSTELKAECDRIHRNQVPKSKFYNALGNSIPISFEELAIAIQWIIIQEDINYPPPRWQGRFMPLRRYVEAIASVETGACSLEEVLSRTLVEGRPPSPKELPDVDYRLAGIPSKP